MENAVVYDRGDPCGRPGVDVSQAIDECASLVHITASAKYTPALLSAARRIRRNIRGTDTILLLEQVCAIGLPATPLQGAQSVARRVAALLADIDCEIQALYGLSALTLWQRMLSRHALVVGADQVEAGLAERGLPNRGTRLFECVCAIHALPCFPGELSVAPPLTPFSL